jgi:succinate dehydrogenase flavin-adding protein (antitoxin of CptAB toxin-antitoxin module)
MIREIDRAVENFKRANCAGVLEKKLVFWHSCLDHLTENLYGFGNGPFSKRLIDACERGGIELDDLLDPKVVRHFQNDLDDDHNCFWFVDARNRFVHDGLDALDNEYYQLTDAIQKARALAERLLLNKVGIDYRDLNEGSRHCLGFPSRRQ